MRWRLLTLGPRPWPALLLALVALLSWLSACGSEGPALIELQSVGPSEVHVGEQLEVRGGGFPPGRPATLTLTGTLALPGVESRDIRLQLPALATSEAVVEVPLPLEYDAALCGVGNGLRHAAFRGAARLAFDPVSDAAPPVYGRLRDVRLELFPGGASSEQLERDAQQAEAVRDFLGLGRLSEVAREGAGSGLAVASLDPEGIAARAGVQMSDVLLSANGVTLFGEGDLLLREDKQFVELELRRSTSRQTLLVQVPTSGFEGHRPLALRWASVLVLATVFSLWLGFGPGGRLLDWVRVWRRLRDRQFVSAFGRSVQSLEGSVWRLPRLELGFCFCVALIASWLVRTRLMSPSLVVLLGLLGAWIVGAIAALAAGGSRPNRSWSLSGGLAAFAHHVVATVPAFALMGACLWLRGNPSLVPNLAIADRPLEWPLLQDPWEALAALAFAFWVLPGRVERFGGRHLATTLNWTQRFYRVSQASSFAVVGFALTSVFLGGWVSASFAEATIPELAFFQTKYALVVLALTVFRVGVSGAPAAGVRSSLSLAELSAVVVRLALGYGVWIGLTLAAWVYVRQNDLFQWFAALIPQALLLCLTLWVAAAWVRARGAWPMRSGPARSGPAASPGRGYEVNPWL